MFLKAIGFILTTLIAFGVGIICGRTGGDEE